MVQYPEYGTNTCYLSDFIEICLKINLLNSAQIRDLYLEKGLSASQIASHFNVSKGAIISRLKRLKINRGIQSGQLTNPNNYRHHVVPYGYSVRDKRLVLNKAEQRICRLVVELIDRREKNHSEVARELSSRNFKNRAGSTKWDSKTVFNIYKRWKGKL
jgi:IS30 family transposase